MNFEEWLKISFPNKGNNAHTVYALKDMQNAFYAGTMHGTEKGETKMAENEAGNTVQDDTVTTTTITTETKKTGKAKITSLIAQIVAAVWVAVWSGMRFFKGEGNTTDVILSGFAIAACFSPVYFNMILDKVKTIRFGD